MSLVERYLALGVDGVTLADTTGMANPRQVAALVRSALDFLPATALTLHFHNIRGLGLANVMAAYAAGARRLTRALAASAAVCSRRERRATSAPKV